MRKNVARACAVWARWCALRDCSIMCVWAQVRHREGCGEEVVGDGGGWRCPKGQDGGVRGGCKGWLCGCGAGDCIFELSMDIFLVGIAVQIRE